MKRNKSKSETELTNLAVDMLRQNLPRDWRVNPLKGRRAGYKLLRIKPPGRKSVDIQILCKPGFQARDILTLSTNQAVNGSKIRLLVAPFLSPTTRSKLIDVGIGYIDSTGAVNLTVEGQGVAIHIRAQGSDRNPFPDDRPLRSLKGPSAARVIRAICDFRPPFGIRELAERCGASAAVVSKVLSLLETEDLIKRDSRKPVMIVDWPGVIRRWTQDYGLRDSHVMRTYIEPRGLGALMEKLKGSKLNYALTGELAVSHLVQETPISNIILFVEDIVKARNQLGLTETKVGANVLIAEPFDNVVFARANIREGLKLVAPSQAAADLLTGPGRSPSVGEALISWMQEHENDWRV